ncbi:MAG TPA: hypothetical protein VK203_10320 [Nostocaceae cyanobacterium]|nr:hypothetical protein [Nostocaceae cyanobacterium]
MSKLTCPICGNDNSINQDCCSVCSYPLVPDRLNFSPLSSPIKLELFPQEAIKWAKNLYLHNLQLKIDLENLPQNFNRNQTQIINEYGLNRGIKIVENVQDLIKNVTEMIVLLQNKLNARPEQRSLIQSELNNLNQIIADLSQPPKLNISENISENIPSPENLTPTEIQIPTNTSPSEDTTSINELQLEVSTDNPEVVETEPTPKPVISTPQIPVPKLSPWLSAYNDKPDFFADYAIDVVVTKDSFEKHLQDINQPIILEKVGKFRGMFWILEPNRLDQCLVPKANLKVDADNLPIVQLLFECINYYPENQKFILIKPALISPFKPSQWQVKELGIIQFL